MLRWALVGVGLLALVAAGQRHLHAHPAVESVSVASVEPTSATVRATLDRYCGVP